MGFVTNRYRGLGRSTMIGVTGNATFVKDQEEVRPHTFDNSLNVFGQLIKGLIAQAAVREVEKLDLIDAKFDCRFSEFSSSDPT